MSAPGEVSRGPPLSLHYVCVTLSCAAAKRVASVVGSVFYFLTTPEREFVWGIVSWWKGEPIGEEPRGRGSRTSSGSSRSVSGENPKDKSRENSPPQLPLGTNADLKLIPPESERPPTAAPLSDKDALIKMPIKTLFAEKARLDAMLKQVQTEIDRRDNLLQPLSKSTNTKSPTGEPRGRSRSPSPGKGKETELPDEDSGVFFDLPQDEDDLNLGASGFVHIRATSLPSPLNSLKAALPGQALLCTLTRKDDTMRIPLAQLLLQDLLNLDSVQNCTFDEQGAFTLTYAQPPSLCISHLPAATWAKMGWMMKSAVWGILALQPTITAAPTITGRVYNTDSGRTIELGPAAFSCLGTYIQLITVLSEPKGEATLRISLNVRSPLEHVLPPVIYANHEKIAEVIHLNLHPEEYV